MKNLNPRSAEAVIILKKSVTLLNRADKKKLGWIAGVQILLSILDLLGVIIIGLITALAVSALTAQVPGNRLSNVLNFFEIKDNSPQIQALILGIVAAALLIIKTLVSLKLTKKSLYFLNIKAAEISGQLVRKFLNRPLQDMQQTSVYQSLYNLTTGVQSMSNGIIATSLSLASDTALLLVLLAGLMFVDPIVAISSLVIFSSTGALLYSAVQVRSQSIGRETALLSVQNNNSIIEIFEGFREAVVRNRRGYYAHKIGQERRELALLNAEMTFFPQISKYVIEITIVLSGFLISALQFLMNDAYIAVAVLSMFMVASSRMGPAVLRIQQSLLTFKTSVGMAQPTIQLIEELSAESEMVIVEEQKMINLVENYEGFDPEVKIRNLTVHYPDRKIPAISNLSLDIHAGSVVAIVGSSGAGKSTLVDCLLGILKASSGTVQISGMKSLDAISLWPGAIGYVPQEVFVSSGTLLENVALGFETSKINLEKVIECLSKVQLLDFVNELRDGVNTTLGDFNSMMSGGQRQRLGIARALYTSPKLLILDEATSALDGQTESEISMAIQSLKGDVTLILVAHRLSTVRHADRVHYLSEGTLKMSGTFTEVRAAIPEFDQQAKLMGL